MKKLKLLSLFLSLILMITTEPSFSQETLQEPVAQAVQETQPSQSDLISNSAEVALYNYYRDQAIKHIEQILPRGKFGVQVSLKVNTAKFKSDNDVEPVKMPLGGSYVTSNELKTSGIIDQSFEKLITYVNQVNIIVSLAPGIPAQVQELITTSLRSMLLIDLKRGDTISFNELPKAIVTAWTPEPSLEIYKQPTMVLSGFFGALMFLMVIAMVFGFRQIGKSLSREALNISGAIKEAIETSGGFGGAQANLPSLAQQTSSMKFDQPESTTSNIWDKVDAETIAAFCFDSVSQPLYSAIPSMLVGNILDSGKSSQVENLLPTSVLNFTGKSSLKPSEIQQIFQKYQSEYRRATRSPLSQMAMKIGMENTQLLNQQLNSMEKAVLLNCLTPLKRSSLLKTYSTDDKLELSKVSQGAMSPIEHKKVEVSLMEKLSKYAKDMDSSEKVQSLNYLSSIILNVESFSEDEMLYEKMQGSSDYQGVLLAFDYFSQENWEECNIQDLAITFSGYSDKFKELLISKYSGKKQEWMKNFLNKYAQSGLDYTAPQVEAVRESIVTKINGIKKSSNAGEEKNAA